MPIQVFSSVTGAGYAEIGDHRVPKCMTLASGDGRQAIASLTQLFSFLFNMIT